LTIEERFGQNLKRCRRRVRLSQEQVALRAGLHRTAVGMLENGQRMARIDTLVKLAAAIEAPVEELLAGIEWVPRYSTGGSFHVAPWAVLPTDRSPIP
jgi:transcriptional regulator with XRE-family HTH domain